MEEIWRPIKGFESSYEISNMGNVKSLSRIAWNGYGFHPLNGRIMKQRNNGRGYLMVCLCKEGKHNKMLVHRLVGEAFIPNPENKPEINHENGVRNFNHVSNLSWVTKSENAYHSFRVLGRKKKSCPQPKGKDCKASKAVVQYDMDGKFIKRFGSGREAQRETGFTQSNIGAACRGKARSAGGYMWKFSSENEVQIKKYEIVFKKGYGHPCNIEVRQMSLERMTIKIHYSIQHASKEIGIDASSISKACRGKAQSAGGYKWEYVK